MYSKPTRVDATSDDQMMMISIVLFKKQTELSSIYLEEGTYLGDTRQDSHPSHRRRSSMGGRAILFSTWVPWQSFKTAHSMQARKNGRCSSNPLDGGQLGTADAKTIVVKASNLVYVSGPPDTEDETWWTSPQEDAEIAQLLEQRLSQGAGDGGGADGGGAGQAGPGGVSGGAEPRSGARDASELKVRGCGQDALATDRCKFPRPSLSLPPSLALPLHSL